MAAVPRPVRRPDHRGQLNATDHRQYRRQPVGRGRVRLRHRPTRFHEWQKGVIDGRIDQPGIPAVGARCLTTRRIGGANRPSTSEVAHINAPTTWGVRGIDGPIRAVVDVTVEALTAHRSRLTIAVDFEGHGIGKLLVPLVVHREARKEMPTNLATLKQRLERQ